MIHVMGADVSEMGIGGQMRHLNGAPCQVLLANSGPLAQHY
ncbi:hypothetical protein P3T25_002470 [Paraburkholderia sp. GAS32]